VTYGEFHGRGNLLHNRRWASFGGFKLTRYYRNDTTIIVQLKINKTRQVRPIFELPALMVPGRGSLLVVLEGVVGGDEVDPELFEPR